MVMLRPWFINKKFPSFLFLLSLILGILVFDLNLLAAKNRFPGHSDESISISSEKMVLKNLENKVIFEGSVLIKRGEMTLNSDWAEVILSKPDESASLLTESKKDEREVTQIITSGNVRMRRGLQRAKGDKGVYKKDGAVFILTGHAEAWDNDFHVKGKVITLFLDEERTVVSESQMVIQKKKKASSENKSLN